MIMRYIFSSRFNIWDLSFALNVAMAITVTGQVWWVTMMIPSVMISAIMERRVCPDEPTPAPEMILCRDAEQAHRVRRQVGHHPHIQVAIPAIPQIFGVSPMKITVMPGVNLDQRIEGCGLRAILHQRQTVWGDRAVFVEL